MNPVSEKVCSLFLWKSIAYSSKNGKDHCWNHAISEMWEWYCHELLHKHVNLKTDIHDNYKAIFTTAGDWLWESDVHYVLDPLHILSDWYLKKKKPWNKNILLHCAQLSGIMNEKYSVIWNKSAYFCLQLKQNKSCPSVVMTITKGSGQHILVVLNILRWVHAYYVKLLLRQAKTIQIDKSVATGHQEWQYYGLPVEWSLPAPCHASRKCTTKQKKSQHQKQSACLI